MRRRSLLATLGAVATGGCLRLQSGADGATATPTPGSTTERDAPESVGPESSTTDTPPPEARRYTLAERWTADSGVGYILTQDGHFYFNDFNLAGEAVPGDGVLWSHRVEFEGSTANLGADAIARGDGVVVYGFFSEPQSVDVPGAQFAAYEDVSGEERWTATIPAAEESAYTNLPKGVTVVDRVAVVGLNVPQRGRLRAYGLDIRTGERLWELDERGGLNGLAAHDGDVYLNAFGGTLVLDPSTGEVTDRRQSWRGANSCIQGNSLFAGSDGVRAYPLADGGVEWSTTGIAEVNSLVADNSLVVAGTETGGVYAVERATGETRWEATTDGTVWQLALSTQHVWVANRETGLTAYDRRDGSNVHRSTQPIGRADIAVVSGTILLGNDTARLYDIEPA